jgi:hypothetical protein
LIYFLLSPAQTGVIWPGEGAHLHCVLALSSTVGHQQRRLFLIVRTGVEILPAAGSVLVAACRWCRQYITQSGADGLEPLAQRGVYSIEDFYRASRADHSAFCVQ